MTAEIGSEVEPDVRTDLRDGSPQKTETGDIGHRHRFYCSAEGCEGSRFIDVGSDGATSDRSLGCSECGQMRLHKPAGGRPLDYYRPEQRDRDQEAGDE